MQPGGNRARFFAPQPVNNPDASSNSNNSEPSRDGKPSCSKEAESMSSNCSSSSITTSSGALVPISKQNLSTDSSYSPHPALEDPENETIARRTRIIETELVFKAKKEGRGKLNVSGLIKHVDSNNLKPAPQSASIREVAEYEELGTRSPRQLSISKLIPKSNGPIYSPSSSHLDTQSPLATQKGFSKTPPPNQLASQQFKIPAQPTPYNGVIAEGATRIKQLSDIVHTDTSNSHISNQLPPASCDDSIKGLTTAFNRKHAGGLKDARFPSPASHLLDGRRGQTQSSHISFEDEPPTNFTEALGARSLSAESRSLSSEMGNGGDFQEAGFQGLEQSRVSAQQHQHMLQEPHGMRGEKRANGSEFEVRGGPLGKKARMEAYDEFLADRRANSPISDSPEPDPGGNPPFKAAISQDRHDFNRQDDRFKAFSGQDVEEYVAIHIERYEAAKKRWTECSHEEWKKGADEMADKFVKVLDYVKEHMKRRVALYASLHAKIDRHEKQCMETSEMLKNAKSQLVAKAGIVVDEGKS